MKYECITDIYSANEKVRERLIETVKSITPDEAAMLPDGEKWTIQQIAEHISMVDFGVSRICANLLAASKTDGKASDGSFKLSENFGSRIAEVAGLKVEAPDRVQPSGNVAIPEALERLAGSGKKLMELRGDFEQIDFTAHTFPHPFFGPLTAGEWLVMLGLHENRHRQQIENLLEKVRQ